MQGLLAFRIQPDAVLALGLAASTGSPVLRLDVVALCALHVVMMNLFFASKGGWTTDRVGNERPRSFL
jgi:hypothetical protein